MKHIAILIFVLLSIGSAINGNAQEVVYLEILPTYPMRFRTSPSEPFQLFGFRQKNIKPIFNENPVSLTAFKQFQSQKSIGSSFIALSYISLGWSIYDLNVNWNINRYYVGAGISIGSLIIGGMFNQAAYQHLYRAVDNVNVGKNPLGAYIPSSFLPSLGVSRHSLGIGLVWDLD